MKNSEGKMLRNSAKESTCPSRANQLSKRRKTALQRLSNKTSGTHPSRRMRSSTVFWTNRRSLGKALLTWPSLLIRSLSSARKTTKTSRNSCQSKELRVMLKNTAHSQCASRERLKCLRSIANRSENGKEGRNLKDLRILCKRTTHRGPLQQLIR